MSLDKISTARRVLLGAGALLLIWSFLPWNGVDCPEILGVGNLCGDTNFNAWHGTGTVMGIFLILLLAWEVLLLVQVVSPDSFKLPELPVKPILITLALAAVTVLFGVIRVFQYEARKWEAWIALLLLIAVAAGAFLRMQDEGGTAAIK